MGCFQNLEATLPTMQQPLSDITWGSLSDYMQLQFLSYMQYYTQTGGVTLHLKTSAAAAETETEQQAEILKIKRVRYFSVGSSWILLLNVCFLSNS